MKPRPKGNINERPSNPRPSAPPPTQKAENLLTDYVRGYIKGFADAIKQYGIDKETGQ